MMNAILCDESLALGGREVQRAEPPMAIEAKTAQN
jgi:hypothetical protein